MRTTYHTLADQLGLPFLLKQLRDGKPDTLIASRSGLTDRLKETDERRDAFLLQEFIPGNKKLCVFVFGGMAAIALLHDSLGWAAESQASDHVMLAGPDGIDPAGRNLAIRAAQATRCSVARVDLIKHWATGQWYVLRVNPNPPVSTGPYIEEKMRAYSGFLQHRTASGRRRRCRRRRARSRPA
jgi:glutathione synthase/RimK-type ligase-like ATP-grasp enzyme